MNFENMNDDRLIHEFKKIIQPDNEENYLEEEYIEKFKNIRSNLKSRKYEIYIDDEQFYDFSYTELYSFAYSKIRSYILKDNTNVLGVEWQERRNLIEEMKFKKVNIASNIDEHYKFISLDDILYSELSDKSKLREICNILENKLKIKKGKYKEINIEINQLKLITNDNIKKYRDKIQCFRHSNNEAILERKSFTEKDIKLLILYGEFIIKNIDIII